MDDSFLAIEAVNTLIEGNETFSQVAFFLYLASGSPSLLTTSIGPRGSSINPKRQQPPQYRPRRHHERDSLPLWGHRPWERPSVSTNRPGPRRPGPTASFGHELDKPEQWSHR